jgi:YfiH family protein
MKRHKKNSLEWLTFDLFSQFPDLEHGIFLRHGGVSKEEFASLNFGLSQGDLPENVEANKKRVLDILKIPVVCQLYQHHGKEVVCAVPGQNLKGDALTTNQTEIGLMILHADCQAAIFYDPMHHVLANVHCGWRGNVLNIYKETIQKMSDLWGSKPGDLFVGISPSLGPEASEFINFRQELPNSFLPFQFKPYYFNLWEISRAQLLECGILPHHMEISRICTYSNPADFFSYRRFPASGRHATIAWLRR